MAIRHAEAVWEGNLKEGSGKFNVKSGAVRDAAYTYASRFEEGKGTNPEELVGAALAGCFSMFLASLLANNNYNPERVHTTATVTLERDETGPKITSIELECEAEVPDIQDEQFQQYARQAKNNCPISRALAGVKEITLNAQLA